MSRHQVVYTTLGLIFLLGLFFRTYRQSQLLGFYYDQGRDALMAQDIISGTNFPAIGPTTGIQGLYLGPFWYYLVTPGYLLGQGSPIAAAYFISLIESLSIILVFIYLSSFSSTLTALTGSLLWSFGYYLIRSSRWFSNPSPLPTFVVLIMLLLVKYQRTPRPKYLLWLGLLLGLALQLEAASAVFFIPVITLFLFRYFGLAGSIRSLLQVFGIVALTHLPLVAFEIKNRFLITTNFLGFLTGKTNTTTGSSWSLPSFQFAATRLRDYFEFLFSKVDTNTTYVSLIFLVLFFLFHLFLILRRPKLHPHLYLLLLWLWIPLFILLFFSGNYGRLYDYYLTGFFPAFIMLVALSWSVIGRLRLPLSLILLVLFLWTNLPFTLNYLHANPDGPQHVSFGNQTAQLIRICQIAPSDRDSTIDFYVPPITPHTYQYLLGWYQSRSICPSGLTISQQDPQFILAEVDTANPQNWLKWASDRQLQTNYQSIASYGGVTIYKRL